MTLSRHVQPNPRRLDNEFWCLLCLQYPIEAGATTLLEYGPDVNPDVDQTEDCCNNAPVTCPVDVVLCCVVLLLAFGMHEHVPHSSEALLQCSFQLVIGCLLFFAELHCHILILMSGRPDR